MRSNNPIRRQVYWFRPLWGSRSGSLCYLGYVLRGTSISPDFMRNLRGRTVFGCTTTPCSMALTQVLHLVIVWSWYSGFALNSVGLLFGKILSLAWEKKVLNPACIPPIWHDCFQQNQWNYLCRIWSRVKKFCKAWEQKHVCLYMLESIHFQAQTKRVLRIMRESHSVRGGEA